MSKDASRSARNVKISLERVRPEHWAVVCAFVLVALAIGLIAFEGLRRSAELTLRIEDLVARSESLSDDIASLESRFSSTTALLEETIEQTHLVLSGEIEKEKQNVSAIESRFGSFQQEVGEISGTVSTLEKLSKTDPELLQKYSKVFFLNEHYVPPRLAEIPSEYKYSDQRDQLIHESVWPYLKSLLVRAQQDGVGMYVFSAYRSFSEQEGLKGRYTIVYGAGTANQFSADQGYSEHQLGTTVDFISTGLGGDVLGFEKTDAYAWLLQYAHTYGFVLSYPDGNAYYIFEPWHWRFVGVKLANDLRDAGKNFYDLEQREIDEYLVSIFE